MDVQARGHWSTISRVQDFGPFVVPARLAYPIMETTDAPPSHEFQVKRTSARKFFYIPSISSSSLLQSQLSFSRSRVNASRA